MRDEWDFSTMRSQPNPYAKKLRAQNEMLKVLYVKPLANYVLYVELSDGRSGHFDMKPYLDKGVFKQLKDIDSFNEVKILFCGIAWTCGPDLSADTLAYELSEVADARDSHDEGFESGVVT
jgi:hypothetical protein